MIRGKDLSPLQTAIHFASKMISYRPCGKEDDVHTSANESGSEEPGHSSSAGRSSVTQTRCFGDLQEDDSQALNGNSVARSEDTHSGVKCSEPLLKKAAVEKLAQNVSCRPQSPETKKLVEIWPKDCKHSRWMQCKGEVFCVLGSFNLILVIILAANLTAGMHKFSLILPWLVTTVGSALLFSRLFFDYAGSQAACYSVSPILFLMAFLSWFIPNISCQSGASANWCESAGGRSLDILGLLVSVSIPWFLTAAPLMAWQTSSLLSVVIPSLLFPTLLAGKPEVINVSLIFLVLMITNLFLLYLRRRTDIQLLAKIDTWEKTFLECKSNEEQARKVLQDKDEDNTDKINKMRQFISYIFHEIRVPFNAVVLGIGHLLAGNVSDEQREILKMMDSSSSSMIRILNDVLDMGKIEAGKVQLEKQPFNMGELISALIWSFKDTLDSKGIEFSLCIDPGTKELLSNHDLVGDKHRVRQVLANYLSNAAKFTPRDGKVSLHVICNGTYTTGSPIFKGEQKSTALDGDLNCEGLLQSRGCSPGRVTEESASAKNRHTVASVTISVEDTGIGISKDDQRRLFEPYIQISAGSSQGGGGTGLGLSFSKRIVELAGGNIGVFSEVGKGSVFLFTIPFQLVEHSFNDKDKEGFQNPFDVLTDPESSLSRSSSISRLSESCVKGRNPKVLIVEDNAVNRKIIRKLLAGFNVESVDAEDGKQAVELCRNGAAYDMILIDKEMPIMDGHEATRELRAMGVKTPIIGLTGNALDSDRNQFLAAGVDDFFTKPISRHQLVKLLEAHRLIVRTRDQENLPSLSLSSMAESPSSRSSVQDSER